MPKKLIEALSENEEKLGFVYQSSINWLNSLSGFIKDKYNTMGFDVINQSTCFQKIHKKNDFNQSDFGEIFSSIYSAYTFLLTLNSLKKSSDRSPYIMNSALMLFYYSINRSIKAVVYAQDKSSVETHMKLVKMYNNVIKFLPEPLCFFAKWERLREYKIVDGNDVAIESNFDLVRVANSYDEYLGHLKQYLKGTAKHYSEKLESDIKKQNRDIKNFTTKKARDLRSRQISKKINMMNCFYRVRGKANYRDHLYLSYRLYDRSQNSDSIDDLINISLFVIKTAIIFLEKRVGSDVVKNYLDDIKDNLIGYDQIEKELKIFDEYCG